MRKSLSYARILVSIQSPRDVRKMEGRYKEPRKRKRKKARSMEHPAGAQNGTSRAEPRERLLRRASVHVVARGEAWFVGGPCTPDRCNPLGTRCSSPTLFPRPSATLLCCLSALPSRVYSAHSAARARFLPPRVLPRARAPPCASGARPAPLCEPRVIPERKGMSREFENSELWTVKKILRHFRFASLACVSQIDRVDSLSESC